MIVLFFVYVIFVFSIDPIHGDGEHGFGVIEMEDDPENHLTTEAWRMKSRSSGRRALNTWPEGYWFYDDYPSCERAPINQGGCGNCWIASVSQAMNDRQCKAYLDAGYDSEWSSSFYASLMQMSRCYNEQYPTTGYEVCNGGWMAGALHTALWEDGAEYNRGANQEPCWTYNSGEINPVASYGCIGDNWGETCPDGGDTWTSNWDNDRIWTETNAYLSPGGDLDIIRQELVDNGPVIVSFTVYTDFYGNYPNTLQHTDNIYEYQTTYVDTNGDSHDTAYAGGHAVIIVGWGETSGRKYWIVKNSWGGWNGLVHGDYDGYFYMIAGDGVSDCGMAGRIDIMDMKVVPPSCGTGGCRNGKTCVSPNTCDCEGQYDGAYCECTLGYCQHGGTCTDDDYCSGCDGSWTGDDCNTCGLACEHGGDCNTAGTICEGCNGAWGGTLCTDCGLACEHGGDCNDAGTTCEDCNGSWGGTLCDVCGLVCEHNGDCDEAGTSCEGCDGAWGGTLCDECSLIGNCEHGGTPDDVCSSCQPCDDSWTGVYCDECSTECLNEGTCLSTGVGCDCPGGWEGTDCSESQCAENWCLNGGVCDGEATCDCDDTDYMGIHCNVTIPTAGDDAEVDDLDSDGGSNVGAVVGAVVGSTVGAAGLGIFIILSAVLCCIITLLCCFALCFGCVILIIGGLGGSGVVAGAVMKGGDDGAGANDNIQFDDSLDPTKPVSNNRKSTLQRASLRPENIQRASKKASDYKRDSVKKVIDRRLNVQKVNELKRKSIQNLQNRRGAVPPPRFNALPQAPNSRFNKPLPQPAFRSNKPLPQMASRSNSRFNKPPPKPVSRYNKPPPKPVSRYNKPPPKPVSRFNRPPAKPVSRFNRPPAKPVSRYNKKAPPKPSKFGRGTNNNGSRFGGGRRPAVNRGNQPVVPGRGNRPVIPKRNY